MTVAYLLEQIESRIIAVTCNGWGADGSLGSIAQSMAIPAGQFRWSDIPLRDIGVEGSVFHRSVNLDWMRTREFTRPRNPNDAAYLDEFVFQFDVGYTQSQLSGQVHPATSGEVLATVAKRATAVALSDAWRIERALGLGELTRSAPTLTPELLDVFRSSDSVNNRLAGGRFICSTQYTVRIQADRALVVTP